MRIQVLTLLCLFVQEISCFVFPKGLPHGTTRKYGGRVQYVTSFRSGLSAVTRRKPDVVQPKELDPAVTQKIQEYTKGATTPSTVLNFLKKRAAEDKSMPLNELVTLSAAAISVEGRRSLLLSTYQSQTSSNQAATLGKFVASPPTTTSFGRSGGASMTANAAAASNNALLIRGKYQVSDPGGAKISSGKSAILDAVRAVDGKGKLKVKLSKNLQALSREANTLQVLREKSGGAAAKATIQVYDFFENYDLRGSHALVMEAGEEDLVGLVRRKGALSSRELKRLCRPILDVLTALEKQDLIWTDLHASNLVTVNGKCKAIDLESAIEVDTKPVDCTPENTPPEIAQLYVFGRLNQARVASSYDVWSFGILMLFLASGGKQLFDGEAGGRVMLSMAMVTPKAVKERVNALVAEKGVAGLIQRILVVDPQRRPTAASLKREWFFASPF